MLRAAAAADLSIVRMRPVVFREGSDPLVGLFGLTRSTDLPTDFRHCTFNEPPLTIRCTDGSVHPEYQALKLAIGFPP